MESLAKPNFFIVGAPKCGTTSLYEYLRAHPDVFMPDRKEPMFFCSDFYRQRRMTEDEYLSLFRNAAPCKRIGEASTWYLYSDAARQAIKLYCRDPRIIIMLRNPVDMMHALHGERLWNGREDIHDFEVALAAEEERRSGRRLPPFAFTPPLLFYKDLARYSSYVRSYLATFGSDQVLVLILEEFVREPDEHYVKVCRFLGVDHGFKPDFEVHNPGKRLRSERLRRITKSRRVNRMGRKFIPEAFRGTASQVRHGVLKANTKVARRPAISAELRSRLERELATEVQNLSVILNRNLVTLWNGANGEGGIGGPAPAPAPAPAPQDIP